MRNFERAGTRRRSPRPRRRRPTSWTSASPSRTTQLLTRRGWRRGAAAQAVILRPAGKSLPRKRGGGDVGAVDATPRPVARNGSVGARRAAVAPSKPVMLRAWPSCRRPPPGHATGRRQAHAQIRRCAHHRTGGGPRGGDLRRPRGYPEWAKREASRDRSPCTSFCPTAAKPKKTRLGRRTSGFADFDDGAVEALLAWRFVAMPNTGEQWGRITFHYKLDGAR